MPPAKPRPPLPAGPFLVVGLARSGAAAAELLAQRGATVIGCDRGAPEEARRLEGSGVEVNLDTDGVELLRRVKTVVKSPGVPREAPAIAAAREGGLEVIGELELAWRALPNRFLAVTGTNGKTTTVELLGHAYREAGEPAEVAGNVGTPLASLVDRVPADATVICEASSFQLEDSSAFAPECAALLNVSPDHLDRHDDFDAYLAAKLRIFANQGNDDVAVWNGDDPALAGRDLGGCGRRVRFCRGRDPDCEVSVESGTIFLGDEALMAVGEVGLLGPHNLENAMAAAACASAMGLDPEAIRRGLAGFGGLPHRLERVATLGDVLYVNDSKATNPAAAIAALRSFPDAGGLHAILGGSLKGGSFEGLAEAVAERCRAAYLIGEAAAAIEAELGDTGVELHRCADLAEAVRAAAGAARPGDVVLLSPACASFDAYRDYEQRGEHFRDLVRSLK
jgi:UDP-N-acetylmuramoylalanine--D-glutamate ligase